MAKRVLFVCTHNCSRSQMAEGMLRAWGGDQFEAFSAGTEPDALREEAIAVMGEIGIDISAHRPKPLTEFAGQEFAWLISVCDLARQQCSAVPGVANPAHWSIEDPSEATGSRDERLVVFRRVRGDIASRIRMFILAAGRDARAGARAAGSGALG